VQGQTLAAPQEGGPQLRPRRRLTVAWYGGTTSDIELVTGTGHWSRIGQDVVAVRWVSIQAATGPHRDAYVCTTALQRPPNQLVECSPHRWSIEPTVQACREYLKLASPTGEGPQPVLRCTPC